LHPVRERTRGFNQAAVIARTVSVTTGLPVDDRSLVRILYSEKHRAGLDAKGRRETVSNAFEVTQQRVIQGENILLVDDVLTTGATANSCATVLLEAGAGTVSVLTIARSRR
jgi:ComF family protein